MTGRLWCEVLYKSNMATSVALYLVQVPRNELQNLRGYKLQAAPVFVDKHFQEVLDICFQLYIALQSSSISCSENELETASSALGGLHYLLNR